jgi:Tfp pilus assembly protein PilX
MKKTPLLVQNAQRGAVLFVSLVVLMVLTIISVTAMQSSTLQGKMAYNLQDRNKATQAAESAARYAWAQLGGAGYGVGEFISNSTSSGLYDARAENTVTGSKLAADWQAIASAAWPWDDATKRAAMPNKITSGDPMKLAAPPQFAISMYDPALRKGSENRKCIPYRIIGAGQGSNSATWVLVELMVIPKTSCYRDVVK